MKKLGLAAIVVVLIIFGMRNRNRPEVSSSASSPSPSPSEINEISIPPKTIAVPVKEMTVPEPAIVNKPEKAGELPEHLRNQGFEIDPEYPTQAIKRTMKGGKEVTTTVDLDSFETKYATSQDALLLLDAKITEDPEFELGGMHKIDINSGEGAMLLGKFQNKEQEIELSIKLREDNGEGKICFFTPAKSFTAPSGSYTLRADAGGYGIIKFNDTHYLRLMWATDQRRVIHGQLLERKADQITLLKKFSVSELSRKKSEELIHCN